MWKRVWSGGLLKQAVGWRFKSPEPPSMSSLLLVLRFRRPFVSPSSSSLGSPCYVSNSNSNYNDFDSRAKLLNPLFNNNRSVSFSSSSSSATTSSDDDSKPTSKSNSDKDTITFTEAKKLMRLVNVEALKMKLGMEGKEVIGYTELLKACESMGVARSIDEAVAFARVLDEAGVVLLFRDKVYLHPDKVVDLVRKAVPLALHPEDDPVRDELKMLQKKKEEIDLRAHKQVRRILWTGLALTTLHVGLFFRLTFWEFSWDVMEPIAFFTTTTGIILGYAYFMITSRDPTYQDLLKRLFLSRQRKLFKKHNFDVNRFRELQFKCKTPLDAGTTIRNRFGVELELEDVLHRD